MQRPGAIAALTGMGGVGKTELATQYARKHQEDYPGGICWLLARESDSARESNLAALIVDYARRYMELEVPQQDSRGRQLSLTEQVEWCWRNWQPSEGMVLVVLDDVTSIGSCREFLPKTTRFRTLMTTRSRNLDSNIKYIDLDVLSPEEALQLLTAILDEKRVQKELVSADKLCKWLGYLPLGLELVGGYLSKKPPNWTLEKMLQRLEAQRLEDEALNQNQALSTAQRGVLEAFELSWKELTGTTQQVATLLSLFAPNIFAWEWVESASGLLNWNSTDVETANKELYNLYLIKWVEDAKGEDKIEIHPLIRECLKSKLKVSEQANDLKRGFAKAMVAIAQKFPELLTQESINSVNDAIPHLEEVAQNLTGAVSPENLIPLFVSLGKFYKEQGLYTIAQPWYDKCVSVVKSYLPEQDPYFATSLNNLAIIYECQGLYEDAERWYQQALELTERVRGKENCDYIISLSGLANSYCFQGRYKEAEPRYKQALKLTKIVLGEEDPDVATNLNNLANCYNSLGRFEDAELLYEEALKLTEKVRGKEDPDFATSLSSLASCYYSQGRYKESEPFYSQERYKKAEQFYEKALELRTKLRGEEHPDVATSLNSLANCYYSQERFEKAEQFYDKALKIRTKVLGEQHPDFATSLSSLANFYSSQRLFEKAEQFYDKALKIRAKVLGEQHPDFATSLSGLAKCYYSQELYEEAEQFYDKALKIRTKVLGEEHYDTVNVRKSLELVRDIISKS